MKGCKVCNNVNHDKITIVTETNFGQGDSTHTCYVRCNSCGYKSKEETNYGIFDDKTFRKAQKNWNE